MRQTNQDLEVRFDDKAIWEYRASDDAPAFGGKEFSTYARNVLSRAARIDEK